MSDEMSDFASQGEYRSSENNLSTGLTMLFIGLALGALTALILTPKTGKQLRRTFRRRYEDARDVVGDFGDQAGDWIDKGSKWADKAKSRVAPLAKPFKK